MPRGIYKRTEETKRKMSKAHKGFFHTKEAKLKIGKAHKGKILTKEHKHKISEANKGVKRKPITEETKRKISEAHKGKILTEETKRRMSEAQKGVKKKKPFTDEHKYKMSEAQKGKILTDEHKRKISEAHKGKILTEETKYRMSKAKKGKITWMKGRLFTEETKQKMRISAMNRMVDNKIFPNFNRISIQYFGILNKTIFSNDGQYGINEYCIPALGYWLDFVSHKYKVIIEYDEEHHNRQTEKDEIRQSKIQAYYPEYAFIRIKEGDAKINILVSLFANKIEVLCG